MSDTSKTLQILVIEDNFGDYVLIEDYLNEINQEVNLKRAISFEEAKRSLAASSHFDAILLDLSLPDIENSETLVKNCIGLAGRAAVIVLTGYGDKEFGVKTLSLGISDYLLKDELNASQLYKSIFYSIERKKTQIQLSESEKKYKSLFQYSPMPMWVLDRHSLKFLSVNDAAVELYQYTREEFMYLTVKDLWVNAEPAIEEIVKTQRHDFFNFKISHRKKDGEIMHLEIQSNPITFDGVDARVTLVNNVTARIEAEELLARSEQRFKAMVQEASDLVMILDFEGQFSHVSPSSELVMGISADELREKNFFTLIHPEDVEDVKNNISELKNNKRIQIPSYRIKSSSNQWRWIETVFTNLISDPDVNGLVANSRDITEFVLQEKRLISSLQKYDIVAKATSDTITDYDVQNDRMKYNEGIQTMFGYKISEIEENGAWFEDKIHPDDIERVRANTIEVYKLNNPNIQIEYRFRCANGEYRYILDRSFLVKDEDGMTVRMIGSMQDMTKIHNYIETIEKNNVRLKNIAWTQSHVVRAPLARIMGLIDLLQTHKEIENQEKLLNEILTSAMELDGIIRKINSQTEQVNELPR